MNVTVTGFRNISVYKYTAWPVGDICSTYQIAWYVFFSRIGSHGISDGGLQDMALPDDGAKKRSAGPHTSERARLRDAITAGLGMYRLVYMTAERCRD